MGEWGRPAPEGPDRRPRRTGRGRPAAPAGEVPARQGRHLRRQLHGRRDRHPRRRGVRGQRPDVPDPPRDADLRRRHREGRAHLAGPGGLPPDPAALLDRRADEPVHLHVDRHHRRATARATFHLVLLDNGRTDTLADEVGRQALRCIRCSACLNVCPVYERAGGHAYGSRLPRPDRRDPHPPTARHRRASSTPRCRTPRPCAAPATRCARSPSTSPRSSSICGNGSSRAARQRPGHRRRPSKPAKGHAAERAAMRAARWAFEPPAAPAHGPATGRPHPPAAPRGACPARARPRRGPTPATCRARAAEPFRDWWQPHQPDESEEREEPGGGRHPGEG